MPLKDLVCTDFVYISANISFTCAGDKIYEMKEWEHTYLLSTGDAWENSS